MFQQQLDTDFVFQARTSPVVNTFATQFIAFAFGTLSADYVEVRSNFSLIYHQNFNYQTLPFHTQVDAPNGSITAILVNGSDVTNILISVGSNFTAQTVSITRASNISVESTFENGISVTVSVVAGLLTYSIAVSSSQNISGMLGNYNENPNDDFVLPNGTVLPSNSTDRQLYVFGQSCKYCNNVHVFENLTL